MNATHDIYSAFRRHRVERDQDGCLIWQGARSGRSPWEYGSFRFQDKLRYAHRVAYEIENGPIPAGMFVDHMCHKPLCVEAAHLRLVTRKQNQENRRGARQDSTTGIRGVIIDRARNKYRGVVVHNGRVHNLGRFNTIEEAESAVMRVRMRLFTHNDIDREDRQG